ncbi:MAG: flagellar basal body-associated FliL family protein [Planctomycetaceae bacterium]
MSTVANKDNPSAAGSASPAKPGLLQNTKMLIAIAVGILMAGEGAVLYVVLAPGADAAKNTSQDGSAVPEPKTGPASNQQEVEIGSFNCTNNLAAPGSILHINFRLAVTIPKSDFNAFKTAEEEHKHRLNEAVIVVLRRSTIEDLNEADLQTIKRRIQEAINKVVNKSYVKDVIMTDFRTLEQ